MRKSGKVENLRFVEPGFRHTPPDKRGEKNEIYNFVSSELNA
jgi:hypothetical protein